MVAHAPLQAEVRDDEIIVTQSSSKFEPSTTRSTTSPVSNLSSW